jgi:hypothetical protein
MQLSPESGNDRSPSPGPKFGEHVWPDQAKIAGFRQDTSGQIRPDPVILAESRQDQWPDPVRSGRIPAILARSGRIISRIRSYPAGFRPFWPDPARSVSGSCHIRPDPGHFGQIRPDQCPDPGHFGQIRPDQCPDPVRSGRIRQIRPDQCPIRSNPARFRQHSAQLPDVAGFRRPAVFRWSDSDAGIIPVTWWCRIPVLPIFERPTIAWFDQSDIKHACKDEEYNFGKRFTVLKTVNRFPKIKEGFTVKPKMVFVDRYFRPYQTP